MRQARTWSPLLQCCSAFTWTNVLGYKIQRNYKGLKITVCTCSWGKFWTKDTKRPKKSPTATSEELGAKAGGPEEKQGTAHAPCTQYQKGWANPLSYPSSPTPGHSPTVTLYKEPARSPFRSKQAREPVVWSHSLLLTLTNPNPNIVTHVYNVWL